MKILKKKQGFSLVELVVAVSILTFVMVTMIAVLMSYLSMSQKTRDINIAKEIISEYTAKTTYDIANKKWTELIASDEDAVIYVKPSIKPSELIPSIVSLDSRIDNRIFIREEIFPESISYPISSTKTSSVSNLKVRVSVFTGTKSGSSFTNSKILAQNSLVFANTSNLVAKEEAP